MVFKNNETKKKLTFGTDFFMMVLYSSLLMSFLLKCGFRKIFTSSMMRSCRWSFWMSCKKRRKSVSYQHLHVGAKLAFSLICKSTAEFGMSSSISMVTF